MKYDIPREAYELDLKVAEAIGLPVGTHFRRTSDGPVLEGCVHQGMETLFRPSTDISDAMSILHSHLLEDCKCVQEFVMTFDGFKWSLGYAGTHPHSQVVANGDTIPLAICNLLLKLKGRSDDRDSKS